MTEILPSELTYQEVEESHSAETFPQPLPRRFHNATRATLALAGTLVALGGSELVTPTAEAAPTHAANTPAIIKDTSSTATASNPIATAPMPVIEPHTVQFGVATGGIDSDGLGHNTLPSDLAEIGMSVVRINWLADENYLQTLPWIQTQVAAFRAAGIEPTINLQQPLDASMADYPKLAARMAALLPQVTYFQPGLEWDSSDFSDLAPTDAMRVNIMAAMAIHKVRPDAIVVGPALASEGDPLDDLQQMIQMAALCCGGMENVFNQEDVHLYYPLAEDLQVLSAYEQVSGEPIVVGETGFSASDLKLQAANYVSLIKDLQLDPRVIRVYFFKLRAAPTDPFDDALVSFKGIPRPSWYAVKNQLTAPIPPPPTGQDPSTSISRRAAQPPRVTRQTGHDKYRRHVARARVSQRR